jgi:transposase-like protein
VVIEAYVNGVSTRKVDHLVSELGIHMSKDLPNAKERSASVTQRLAKTVPKVAALLVAAEEDLLAFYRFPQPVGRSYARSTTSSASTRRSPGARTSSASFPTTAR